MWRRMWTHMKEAAVARPPHARACASADEHFRGHSFQRMRLSIVGLEEAQEGIPAGREIDGEAPLPTRVPRDVRHCREGPPNTGPQLGGDRGKALGQRHNGELVCQLPAVSDTKHDPTGGDRGRMAEDELTHSDGEERRTSGSRRAIGADAGRQGERAERRRNDEYDGKAS